MASRSTPSKTKIMVAAVYSWVIFLQKTNAPTNSLKTWATLPYNYLTN